MLDQADQLRLHGMYLELAYALERHRRWRTWLGARIETMTGEYRRRELEVAGVALRIGSEVYMAGARSRGGRYGGAIGAGAFAIGVYVEGTARSLPNELGTVGLGAGVSVRVPFLAAIGP